MNDQDYASIITQLIERIRRVPYTAGLREFTKKQLLGCALEAMLADKKGKLEFLQGMTALAKAVADEKKLDDVSPRVPLNDAKLRASTDTTTLRSEATLWYFTGNNERAITYYPTKMCAEIACRAQFPDESEHDRYRRIYYHTFTRET